MGQTTKDSRWAPKRATLEFFHSKGGIDLDGPLSPVVPATPAALLLAMTKYGKLKREQVLVPAIELAERGFVVSENLQGVLQHNVKRLQGFPSSLPVWFRGGQPLQMGDVVIRKNLGQSAAVANLAGRAPDDDRAEVLAVLRQHFGADVTALALGKQR